MTTARPLSEWTEDDGDVLWWKFPVEEAPYVGSPLCCGYSVEVRMFTGVVSRFNVCGWPGYHTHWTPLPEIPERIEDVGEREYRSWFSGPAR